MLRSAVCNVADVMPKCLPALGVGRVILHTSAVLTSSHHNLHPLAVHGDRVLSSHCLFFFTTCVLLYDVSCRTCARSS
jgi:hypothetical protein